MLTDDQIQSYRQQGFLLVKNVFGREELASIRDRCRAAVSGAAGQGMAVSPMGGDFQRNLLTIDSLSGLPFDDRLLGIARSVLGDTLVFFGHSYYTRDIYEPGAHIPGRHLHHDAKGTRENIFNRDHRSFSQAYPVMLMAIYFEDYKNNSGGLKVCPGSHLQDTSYFDEKTFQHFDVPSEPGDVVCFCARVLHSPYSLRLKAAPEKGLHPREEDTMFKQSPELFIPTPRERDTIFVGFAAPAEETDLYLKHRALKGLNHALKADFPYSDKHFLQTVQQKRILLSYTGMIAQAAGRMAHLWREANKTGVPINQETLREELTVFARLCSANREFSTLYEFIPPGRSLERLADVANLIDELTAKLNGYLEMSRTQYNDWHMAAI